MMLEDYKLGSTNLELNIETKDQATDSADETCNDRIETIKMEDYSTTTDQNHNNSVLYCGKLKMNHNEIVSDSKEFYELKPLQHDRNHVETEGLWYEKNTEYDIENSAERNDNAYRFEKQEFKLEECHDTSTFKQQINNNVSVKEEYDLIVHIKELDTLHHEFIIKDEIETDDHTLKNDACYISEFQTASDQIVKRPQKRHVNIKHKKQNMRKCPLCEYKTKRSDSLKLHINAKHTKLNMYNCIYCDYTTAWVNDLKRHVNGKHSKNKLQKCSFCDYETLRVSDLNYHVNAKHTKQKMHKCDYCDYEGSRAYKMNETIKMDERWSPIDTKITSDEKDITPRHDKNTIREANIEICNPIKLEVQDTINPFCEDKNVQCKEEYNLDVSNNGDNHVVKTLHCEHVIKNELTSEEIDDKNFFLQKCNYCEFETNQSSNLGSHLELNHSEHNVYKCDFCLNIYVRNDDLICHVNIVHSNDIKTESDHLNQNQVNYSVPDVVNQSKEKMQKCDYCAYKTVKSINLKNHVNARHTKQIMHKCDYCKYETPYIWYLKLHVNAKHTKQSMHKCDFCEYKTPHVNYLKVHVNYKHTQQNMHKCDFCDYKTARANTLKVHVNAKHTKHIMHKCDYCDHETAHLTSLKLHVNAKHTKQNIHKCDHCDYENAFISNLKVHINAVHTKQSMKKCDYCDYETGHNSALKVHVNTKHLKQNMHKCDYCDYEAYRVGVLKLHVNAKHTKVNSFKCHHCKHETTNSQNLKRHIKSKHKHTQ